MWDTVGFIHVNQNLPVGLEPERQFRYFHSQVYVQTTLNNLAVNQEGMVGHVVGNW